MRIVIICLILSFSTPVLAQNTDQQPRLWDRITTGQWLPSQWTIFNKTKEWDSSHWHGQDFMRDMDPDKGVKQASLNVSRSMYAGQEPVSPDEFINNLRQSNIIGRIYNPEFGFFWDRQTSQDVVIEVGHNFYTLSYADQSVIMDMLARAFPRDSYILKDQNTNKVIGQLTSSGFNLY